MSYALVIVERPEEGWPEAIAFYVHKLPKVGDSEKIDEGAIRIAEGSWLVNLDTDVIVLAQIVVAAQRAKTPYHVLVSDQKPNLVSSGNPPKN